MPTLDRITIYPVKSLDGVEVSRALVLPSGALENDRRWRLVDLEGRVIHAKRTPLLHPIRAEFALDQRLVTLSIDPVAVQAAALPNGDRLRVLAPESFHLVPGSGGPCEWLSQALGLEVLLEERADGGFPDDRDAAGPTLISTATLAEVARWFGFDLAESRRRFRVNLEIGGCECFWEDALASPAQACLRVRSAASSDQSVDHSVDQSSDHLPVDPYADLPPAQPREFAIGQSRFVAAKACRRCVVPSRDSRTGAETIHFRDAFEARRGRGLRPDTDTRAWSHLYRLAINTRAVLSGYSQKAAQSIACGQPLQLKSV